LVELNSLIVDDLRGTLPNPHSPSNWIYLDYPRLDATFPRISVTQISASISELGIGENIGQTTGRLVSIDYDIDIWVKIADRFIINGTTYVGTALRDKYTDLVLEALEALKPQWKTEDDIVDVEITNIATEALDEENELHRKTVTIRVTFIWED